MKKFIAIYLLGVVSISIFIFMSLIFFKNVQNSIESLEKKIETRHEKILREIQ